MKRSLHTKGFKALLATQFLGAFNDNAFKLVVSLLAVNVFVNTSGGTEYLSLPTAMFILPFLLFSTYAGFLADRIGKYKVIIATKFLEFIVMGLGFWALSSVSLPAILVVLFLMGMQSTVFSPAKYGILPEILAKNDLSEGNGAIQLWTYLAVIFGTAFGGVIYSLTKQHPATAAFIFMGVSLLGIVTSFFVTRVAPSGSRRKFTFNFPVEIYRNIKMIRGEKAVLTGIIALVYFSLLAAIFQLNILLYARKIMGVSEISTGFLLTVLALGVGIGSIAAGKVSEQKIEFGLVPLGALGLSVFSLTLGFTYSSFLVTAVCLWLLGVSAGFYIIPLNTYVQQQSPRQRRGQVLATLNFFSFFAILCGTGIIYVLREWAGLNAAHIFLVSGIGTVAATGYILKALPTCFVRLINWVITHTIYRIRAVGTEHVPEQGGALLIANHVSFIDPLLILGVLTREVRFVMWRRMYELKPIHWLCRLMRVIPISYDDPPKHLAESLREARSAIKKGQLVCIFAEGHLTRTGTVRSFNRGFEHIMKGVDAPIIPLYLDRIWGSIFSFEGGRFFWKRPKMIPYPCTICFGSALDSTAQAHEVRSAVLELSTAAFQLRGRDQKKLHIAFIDEAKRHPFRFCMADSTGAELSYAKVLAGVLLMGHKLFNAENTHRQEYMVGILLPASCAASLVNGAVLLRGKVPVNLNFTASKDSLEYAIDQCGISKIITSRKFLEKINLSVDRQDREVIFLEDLKKAVSRREQLSSFLTALCVPAEIIKKHFVHGDRYDVNDIATVIFSSGSTGQPKGVMLTHGNIFSNIEGFYQVMQLDRNDVILGVLPFFHSFGFTATLCLPPGSGIGVVYHHNPLDAKMVGKLAKKYKATMLLGTPTFFSAYLKKCSPDEFKTIRFALAGAEKLKQGIADSFYEKFGILPFEGYGATELSPIVALGVPHQPAKKNQQTQVGHKPGSVGQPIPGVAVKIVDPDTHAPLPYNQEGLMLVKGPSVMAGYLNRPEKTQEVIRDGWYVTGDIAIMDEDGFIRITDRLSRFSKIGGEMVPHVKVEEEILEVLGESEPVCAVTAVSDEKKGERLVVLYTGDIDIDEVRTQLAARGLPNLWIPKKESFYRIQEIPFLGSGKLDLKQIKVIAQEWSGA
ncbi:MAG: MFS transporter [Candidatus Omnitrophica bacterium]|nr:MFS transporter [Candidatus Omnitrophota bacterium]